MDFYQVGIKEVKGKKPLLYPNFQVSRSKDLMARGGKFYAIWDEQRGIWSMDAYDVVRLVDLDLHTQAQRYQDEMGTPVTVLDMKSYESKRWDEFTKFTKHMDGSHHQLDEHLTFANSEIKKSDYVSRRLPYELAPGDFSAWDELMGVLYSIEERAKIEWAIGAIVAGDAKNIQKFIVIYGPAATGKSTVLNIIQKLFVGYTANFEAKALGTGNGFATEVFRDNPLVAIQHDGDLSRISDNTKLNSIIAHEDMVMNEKYKASYTSRVNAFLFMGTNQPVRISDAKSGIIRRLIDVHPSGVTFPAKHYNTLMAKIEFELGAIAYHCLEVYRSMGKHFYNAYRPVEMMLQTDVFFNYIEAYYDVFKEQDGVTLRQAYTLYKEYCTESGIERILPQFKFRAELENYFDHFHKRIMIDGTAMRSYFSGFNANKFKTPKDDTTFSLVMEETTSIFDQEFAEQPAQFATPDEMPQKRWSTVKTYLADLDTSQLHFVKVPEGHIVIDFDLRDDDGRKSLERNLEAASSWPATYAELSKSGAGVHLHYNYDGDAGELNSVYSDGIEVKVFRGDSSLRRRLSRCNNVPVATINSGLPMKEKKVLHSNTIQSEKGLRDLIARNLRKEIHPGTKPSIDFIKHVLDEAYESKMLYDVTDMRNKIMAFANNSTNQPLQSLKTVQLMKFQSEPLNDLPEPAKDDRLVFFDVEVYPNLFVVCWKYEGDANIVRMINPEAQEVEGLFNYKLIGFNNRRYDNHILYARYMGYNNEQLFRLSQKVIDGAVGSMFGEAYNLSYADIYDFSSKKQGLKKFGIDLGMHHMELDLPWDQPVPDHMVDKVVEYCVNDVLTTEATLEDRRQDFVARQILSELSGLPVNDTTQKHTARIIFGEDRNPQRHFQYTHLEEMFPGYNFDRGTSTYRDEIVGEGGYVYAEPGIYENVALLDVASMHPTSIEQLVLFGDYTKNFAALKSARLAIKHKDYKTARTVLDGKLAKFLADDEGSEALAFALKIVINSVYGLTSAKFDNPFRDTRNRDNIVAKRGALFMIDLKHAVQEQGYTVAHIKTDSIKIPNADPQIIQFVYEFGEKYGYEFDHEATYEKFCLVNDAVYVAKKADCMSECWIAVGAQFQHPYVFKTLFNDGMEITFDDYCETKQVMKGVMYLDFDAIQKPMHDYQGRHFVGRTGRFLPVTEEAGGGLLLRINEDKSYAVAGTKGYFWIEAEMAQINKDPFQGLDWRYYDHLTDEAKKTISKFGDFEAFVS